VYYDYYQTEAGDIWWEEYVNDANASGTGDTFPSFYVRYEIVAEHSWLGIEVDHWVDGVMVTSEIQINGFEEGDFGIQFEERDVFDIPENGSSSGQLHYYGNLDHVAYINNNGSYITVPERLHLTAESVALSDVGSDNQVNQIERENRDAAEEFDARQGAASSFFGNEQNLIVFGRSPQDKIHEPGGDDKRPLASADFLGNDVRDGSPSVSGPNLSVRAGGRTDTWSDGNYESDSPNGDPALPAGTIYSAVNFNVQDISVSTSYWFEPEPIGVFI
jgi:hypothetical protein